MQKIISKRFSINIREILKTIGMFFLGAIGDLLLQWHDMWKSDHAVALDFYQILHTAGVMTAMYFIRIFVTGGKKDKEIIDAA